MASPLKVQSIAELEGPSRVEHPRRHGAPSERGFVVAVLEVGALLPPLDMCRAADLTDVEPLPDSPGRSLVALPTVTVETETGPMLYRLPHQLGHWAFTNHALLVHGYKLFPGEVEFYLRDGRYMADVHSC